MLSIIVELMRIPTNRINL